MHRKFNEMVAGSDGDFVNQILDSSTKYHPGRRHRKDAVHSAAFAIGQIGHIDPDAGILALAHLALDGNYRVSELRPVERLPGFREHRFKRTDPRPRQRYFERLRRQNQIQNQNQNPERQSY